MQTSQHRALRRTLPWWAQTFILLVVFMAGCIVGAMLSAKVIHARMNYYRQHAYALSSDILPRLQLRLNLTEEQSGQIRTIIERRHPSMMENRKRSDQAIRNEFRAMEQDIAAVLDDQQKQRWYMIADSVRNRFLPPAPDEQ